MPALYAPPRRTTPMALDAVSPIGQPMELARIDFVRHDGVAVCSRITADGSVAIVRLDDGRRFILRGVLHYHIRQVYIREDIPLVVAHDCEFCGDPAARVESFDRDVFVCDACSA